MRNLFVKLFFVVVFFLPKNGLADMIGNCSSCDPDYNASFKVENLNSFPDYIFFSKGFYYDSVLIVNDKLFNKTITHHDHEPIDIYAKNIKTGEVTLPTAIWPNYQGTIIITIQKIENDSIYFKTDLVKTQQNSFYNIQPVSFLTKLLILISFIALFIYCLTLFRKKSLTNV